MTTPTLNPTPDFTVITGAAGWFGTALTHALCGRGDTCAGRHNATPSAQHATDWRRAGELRVLVEHRGDAERLEALSTADTTVRAVVGDVRATEDVAALFANIAPTAVVDVIHAAGIIHPPDVATFDSVNAQGTHHVVQQALASDVRRVVHVSSNSPFGCNATPGDVFGHVEPYRPYLEYGASKMRAELHVSHAVEQGLNAVIVRPPWFYGPHQPERQTAFFRMVRAGRFPIFGNGRQRRSMTYVDNLVQGVCRAELVETDPGLGWWVADERPYEMREIVAAVANSLERAGLAVTPQRISLPAFVGDLAERADRALQSRGRYQQQLHVLGELNKTIACDISATRRDLGYEPAVSLTEGMDRSVAWCLQNGYSL